MRVDTANNQLSVNPMFSWREALFIASSPTRRRPVFATRSPLERAVLALIEPLIVPTRRSSSRRTSSEMVFHDFDWRLNDLTGR